MRPRWKSAANKRSLPLRDAIARPLKIAPSTWAAGCAWVENMGGGTFGFQPVMSPLSESNRNSAGPLWPAPSSTTKPDVGLKTCPVGPSPGMLTTSGTIVGGPVTPSPVYRAATLVPLAATHTGVVGPCAMPQALTRLGSVTSALPGTSETRLCWTTRLGALASAVPSTPTATRLATPTAAASIRIRCRCIEEPPSSRAPMARVLRYGVRRYGQGWFSRSWETFAEASVGPPAERLKDP